MPTGGVVAGHADDVQMAHGASPPATAKATCNAVAPIKSPNATRMIAPSLHCQAAVVRIGESFGEFSCSVFRTDTAPTANGTAASYLSKGASQGTAANRPPGSAGSAQSLVTADQRLEGSSSPAAAASGGSGVESASCRLAAARAVHQGMRLPLNCAAEGVPRWELLVYTTFHDEDEGTFAGQGNRSGYHGGHPNSAAPTSTPAAATEESHSLTATEGTEGEDNVVPDGALVCFRQTLPTSKMSKVVKLAAGRRYTVCVRCYCRSSVCWSAWSEPIQTATFFPVETRVVEIGVDYVHCTWDRSLQRNEEQLAKETDAATTEWARSIPDFQLRLLREVDMAEHYLQAFESGCRSVTIRDLQPGTRYIVLMRYRTVIHTMREWVEVTRLVTESPIDVRLAARGEDTFTFEWRRGSSEVARAKATDGPIEAPFHVNDNGEDTDDDGEEKALHAVLGYLQPRLKVHEYELTVESFGLLFDPIVVPASVHQYTVKDLFPSTSYSVCVRALSVEGRWGGRSKPLEVRTADRPDVSVAAIGESFASFAWTRKDGEESRETQLQYRVLSLSSAYNQTETVDLAASPTGQPVRLVHVEHLRSGSDYIFSLRISIDGTWGLWTEPKRFTTAPSVALTFLERGEDFLTLNWPSTGLAAGLKREDLRPSNLPEEPLPMYNIVVVKVDEAGKRTSILNERVTRDATQRGFRVNGLEADTTYDVQCRTWQRNPVTGFEDWGEYSPSVRMRTLQPVALHVWDVGEDFIHIMWRRGLSEKNTGDMEAAKPHADGTPADWDFLKYEVVMGCVDTGEESMLHRQVLDTSYTITQLKPSTTYTIAVRACDEQGQWGLWSRVKVRTLASINTQIHEIGEDFVRLVWHRSGGWIDMDLHDVTVADAFVSKYSVFVYAKELPGIPAVPHTQSGYELGGGRSDVARFDVVSCEHTSLRVDSLLPDREYIAVVRAATSSGRWGLWSRPVHFRTNPQFRIPTHQLTIGENYVNVVWSRGEAETQAMTGTGVERDHSSTERVPVQLGDCAVTGQELWIHGVTTAYSKLYALEADVRELKVNELHPACAYIIQIRVRGRSGCWGPWSVPAHILTRGTIVAAVDEVAEDFITVRWERRKVANPNQYPTGRGIVTSYHLRVYNVDGVHMETFLGDGDCPYRVTGLTANTYYCVELKANYNDEEWGLWSMPLWCLTMQPMRIQAKLISEEFCCLQLIRPSQQRRLPEDDGNPATVDRVLANGKLRPTIMLCVTSPILSKAPYSNATAKTGLVRTLNVNDALPPDAAHQRLVYQTELLNSAEIAEHTVPNLKCNTVYSVSVRTKLANGEWGMWSPSLLFATVPATRVSFTSIGESFVGVEWVRHAQTIPPQLEEERKVVFGVASITASRVRVREGNGTYQHTYTVEGAANTLRMEHLTPATTYMVCVQTFNDNYEWGVWSEEQKVRTVPGMEIHVQHVSEDALWVSWSRRTDLHVVGDADTVFNVNISARAYEICLTGEGGFTYTQETDSTSLFFRGLMPDSVYTIHVRALFTQSENWGQWSSQAFRTKPQMRITFGNIGEHFVMLEWRRHLPKPTRADVLMLRSTDDDYEAGGTSVFNGSGGHASLMLRDSPGDSAATRGLSTTGALGASRQQRPIAEPEDVVQLYRFKVQRVGEQHSTVYNIGPTVNSFRLRDLQPSSEYRVWVCAKGYEGVWGFWSEESRVRTLPRLQLEVVNIGEDYVRAQWNRAAWDGAVMASDDRTIVRQVDGAVSGYEVRVLASDGTVAAIKSTNFREVAAVLSGLRLSSLYKIQVRARDTYDAWGLWSDPVPFYTLKPVAVGLQRLGETFVDVRWSRSVQYHHYHSTTGEATGEVAEARKTHVDGREVLYPDDRVTRWHMRVTCNRIFAGMPQTDDYRESYAEEGVQSLRIENLLPQAAYSVAVRGLNHAGEWGHWSPELVVTTSPLLKVGVEVAGETFLQLAWQRPAIRTGLVASSNPIESGRDSARARVHDLDEAEDSLRVRPHLENKFPSFRGGVVHSHLAHEEGEDEEADSEDDAAALPFFDSAAPESYLCFPSDAEMHNYQVTIRPMATELAFDEADEPLIDGARVYETTQPALRLGNLLPGTRYAISVREQQVDEEGRPISGEWGAPSEVVCTQTVPPVLVIPQEIGEDYCMIEWRRGTHTAAFADEEPSPSGATAQASSPLDAKGAPTTAMRLTEATTIAGQKAVEYQLQMRRLNSDGATLYEGPLALDSVVSVPSSVSCYHISNLVPSSVYEVRVRAKMESAQWGMWSPPTRFLTQSRLELRVERVQEVAVRVSWGRPRGVKGFQFGCRSVPVEKQEENYVVGTAEEEQEEISEEENATDDQDEMDAVVEVRRPTLAEISGSQVIEPDDAVHEYELILEGISTDKQQRLTFGQYTHSALVEGLQQDQLYCVSVRSLSEKQHWSRFCPKVTLLTLAGVQIQVKQYTECTALLEWFRPPPDVRKFADLLARHEKEALHQCDDRERRELIELKRRIQEHESKGEVAGPATAGWMNPAAREEHNILLRDEATRHYRADCVVTGDPDCTGYELNLTLQDGEVCFPFISAIDGLRRRSRSVVSSVSSTRDLLTASKRSIYPGASPLGVGQRGPLSTASYSSFRERKRDGSVKTPNFHGIASGSVAPACPTAPGDTSITLLDVQLQPNVRELMIQGLSPNAVFSARLRARGVPDTWQPWSQPAKLVTLPLIQLDQSRFGEHYINLYWYRGDPSMMAAAAEESEEHRRLQREFRNFTERDLEERRTVLSPAAFEELVARLRRLRLLRRLSAARAKRHAEGEMGLTVDPAYPIQGFQLRVIDEAGTISEHYLPNKQYNDPEAPPTMSFTATGLQPNSMYVCCLCPHYGDDVWGCWTVPLKYMTHNIIQLDITYISETFVDLEWWRLDNKPASPLDEFDTLLSSRYTEEVQVYQLRITHEDADTGEEVEEFRNMRACNVLRIDALLPDMKYTIAVREWDAKGDWGLWSASCSCVTLPSIVATVSEVKECSVQISWGRATPRIDYENDMHVLEDNSEITGFYLRLEEVPLRDHSSPLAPPTPRMLTSPMGISGHGSDSADILSNTAAVNMSNNSFAEGSAVAAEGRQRYTDSEELEGTLAFGFQRGGPLPPEKHPELHDGLVMDHDEGGRALEQTATSSYGRQHYLLVKRISSSTQSHAFLSDLRPQTVYQVQVMAETTGGQVGPWSAQHFVITTPQLRLSAPTIDEHYVSLQWGRASLGPLAAQLAGNAGLGGVNTANMSLAANGPAGMSSESGGTAFAIRTPVGAAVALPTTKVVAYELEVRGTAESDFKFSTRLDSNAPAGDFRVTGLAMDHVYVARIRSFSDAGEASLWSPELAFVTLQPLVVQPQEMTENTVGMCWGRPEQRPELYGPRANSDPAPSVGGTVVLPPAAAAAATDGLASTASLFPPPLQTLVHHYPVVCVGDREAVKYLVRVYHVTEQAPPRMLLERYLNGNVTKLTVNALIPNSLYLLYVRAINRDGLWSEWSEGRSVYTMKPLLATIATVGEDFVRLQWARDAPEELHYTPAAVAVAAVTSATAATTGAEAGDQNTTSTAGAMVEEDEQGEETPLRPAQPLGEEEAETAGSPQAANKGTIDSPNAVKIWQQGRRFRLQDKPSEVGAVYCSATTSIQSFTISVRRSDEPEGYMIEVPGYMGQHTVPALQPDSVYLICIRAQYGSGEVGPWSDIVRSGTYNRLAMDLREVGEDYVSTSWQRKANTIHMASVHIGKVEETVCYELRVRDYTDVPLGEEEGETALRRDSEGRSLFLHANQRHCIMRELLSNHRYRFSVRRWYQPHDGFAKSDATAAITADRNSLSNAGEESNCPALDGEHDGSNGSPGKDTGTRPDLSSSVDTLQLYTQSTSTVMDGALRDLMVKARAAPGVWSESEYVVTLRDMVCTVERVGEEFFEVHWSRDPRAVPLPVRRVMPVKAVQNYQLRIDEMVRDGSGVETGRGSNTVHMDELMGPTETTYFNKSLKPNTLYKVEVRCCIEKMWGRWSRPVYIITQSCLQVEVSRIGEECATITWYRPCEPLTLPDGEVAVSGDEEEADGSYQLDVSGVGFNYQISKRFKASRTSYAVKHLDADALYAVRVRSGDGIHQACSLWSESTCFATLKPIQVTLSMPTEQFVQVEWRRPPQTKEEYAGRFEQQAGASACTAPALAPDSSSAAKTPVLSHQRDGGAELGAPAKPASQPAALHPWDTIQLGNPGSLAYHLCVFNTEVTPSVAAVDKQFHKDVQRFRVNGLAADTPYVIIVRACCEATGDWGLWSEERSFRTLKLLVPVVSSVGESYAKLTWERSEADQRGPSGKSLDMAGCSALGVPTLPTKYLLVLRSTRYGTLEREITDEECRGGGGLVTPTREGYQVSTYSLTHLQPGTEYAVALQPCYGGSGDWGLWSQAASFTTLYAVQLTANITKDAVDLNWGRSCPAPTVAFAEDVVVASTADGQANHHPSGGSPEPPFSGPVAALPPAGSYTPAGTTLANSRTVSRYQLVVFREADLAALYPRGSSLEGSLVQQYSGSPALLPNVSTTQDGHSNDHRGSSLRQGSTALKQAHQQSCGGSQTSRMQNSFSGTPDVYADNAETAIPDMDVAVLAGLESAAGLSKAPKDSFFSKQYDMTEEAVKSDLSLPSKVPNLRGGGVMVTSPPTSLSAMHEHIEGLAADTLYVARIHAMDLNGFWGAAVEVRFMTPPPAPSQVVLRRVNAQFCSLQWVAPELNEPAEGAAPQGRYRYVIEQCILQADGPSSSSPAGTGTISISTSVSTRKAATANTNSAPDWHVVDSVEDTNVCAVRISGLLSRMRCRVKCARRILSSLFSTVEESGGTTGFVDHLGPYSEFSETVAVSSGTPPEGVVDPHLTSLSQNTATLEWLPPPKPSEAAAGRYTRPTYRIYLANTTDQPYPVLLTTVHRPTYALTNLTPSTTYTVQVVAENADGVSFRNPILRFQTKAEDDQTVSRLEKGGGDDGSAAEKPLPLAEIVPYHGYRSLPMVEEGGTGEAKSEEGAVVDIPSGRRRKTTLPKPPSSRPSRRGRGGAGSKKRGSSTAGSGSGRKSAGRGRSSSSSGNKRSSTFTPKAFAAETTRDAPSPRGVVLPPLAKTL